MTTRDDSKAAEYTAPFYSPKQVSKPAPCQGGCMNCGDIRGWIGTVAQRRKTGLSKEQAFERAWRIITDVNPFPATLGRICPHPCEKHCNRAELDEPLAINAMERFLGDFAIRESLPLIRDGAARDDYWVGVVGAGPSGLSFAYQMARRGYRVTIYESRDKAGGMLRYGVPDYRLPQEVLDAEIQRILDLGVELRLHTRIGRDVTVEQLRARHDCIYLGIGAQQGRSLDIPGAEGPGVMTGAEYLDRVNRGERLTVGDRVLVVGGGNSAIDAARTARREGAQVTLQYRRTREEMPAIAHEIEDAIEEGVELMELAAPMEIRRDARLNPVAVRFQRMRLGEVDASGRRRPVPIEGKQAELPVSCVILAISQVPVLDGLESLSQQRGWLIADQETSLGSGVLAGGDALGLGVAGDAIVQGRRAAEALHARIESGEGPTKAEVEPDRITADRVLMDTKPPSPAAHAPELPVTERIADGQREVAASISEDQFLAEVERCFSCGSCFGCEQCYMYCTSGCFTRVEEPQPGMYFTLRLDECQSCGKCIEVCPCGFLEIRE